MRRYLLPLLLLPCSLWAQTATNSLVTISLQDARTSSTFFANRTMWIQGTSLPQGNNGAVVQYSKIITNTDANGTVVLPLYEGVYHVTTQPPPDRADFYFWVPTNSMTMNAGDYLTNNGSVYTPGVPFITQLTSSNSSVSFYPANGRGASIDLSAASGSVTPATVTNTAAYIAGQTNSLAVQKAGDTATNLVLMSQPDMVRYSVKLFGAKGDGQIANLCYMTNGYPTLICPNAHFTAGDVGKAISVAQAQTNYMCLSSTIASVLNATNITLADNAAATASGVWSVYGHDDGPAIQGAINWCTTNLLANGMSVTLSFPTGICMVNISIQDPGNFTNHYNAQLYVPSFGPLTGQTVPTLRFTGTAVPQTQLAQNGIFSLAAQGSVIWSTLGHFNGGAMFNFEDTTNPVQIAGQANLNDYVPVIGLRVEFENLTIRMPSNPDGSALWLRGASGASVENVLLDDGYGDSHAPQPTFTNSYAIAAPASLTRGPYLMRNVTVIGFNKAMMVGEHGENLELHAFTCDTGLDLSRASGHMSDFALFDCEETRQAIYFNASVQGGATIRTMRIETYPTDGPQTGWNTPFQFINANTPSLVSGYCWFTATPFTTNIVMPTGLNMQVWQSTFNGATFGNPVLLTPWTVADGLNAGLVSLSARSNINLSIQRDDWQDAAMSTRTAPTSTAWEWDHQSELNGASLSFNAAIPGAPMLGELEIKTNGDLVIVRGQAIGDGSGLTNLNASALSTGTVPSARLPIATTSILGGVIPDGTSITVNGSGVISSTGGGGSGLPGTNSVIAYGSAQRTNWVAETPGGWFETNSAGGYVTVSNGNLTASGNIDSATATVGTLSITNGGLSSIAGPMLTTNGSGDVTASYNGGALTNLNASALASGTIPSGVIPGGLSVATVTASSSITTPILYDASTVTAMDVNNRFLKNLLGNTVLDFSGSSVVGSGSGLTNLTLFISTNAFGTVLIASAANFTNMTANVSITGISGLDMNRFCSAYLLATNGTAGALTVTFPATTKGTGTNAVMGPVWSVPAGTMPQFQINVLGLYTNVTCVF